MTDSDRSLRSDVRKGARLADSNVIFDALTDVVEYRGDVTVVRRSGGEPVEGYVFDCVKRDDCARAQLRMLPKSGGSAVTIPLDDIATLEVTGRDTAAGKSFETWVKKYVAKKTAGEPANIDSDA